MAYKKKKGATAGSVLQVPRSARPAKEVSPILFEVTLVPLLGEKLDKAI